MRGPRGLCVLPPPCGPQVGKANLLTRRGETDRSSSDCGGTGGGLGDHGVSPAPHQSLFAAAGRFSRERPNPQRSWDYPGAIPKGTWAT